MDDDPGTLVLATCSGAEFERKLAWCFEADGEGGMLGPETQDCDAETQAVIKALEAHFEANGHRPEVVASEWVWETTAQAKKALAVARLALKNFRADAPWPAWAVQAKAAGWKPPKGWMP